MSEHPNKKNWVELAEKQMKGKSIDTLNWATPEGITVKPLYTAEDLGVSQYPARHGAVCTWTHGYHVRRTAVDYSSVRRVLNSQGIQCLLSQGAGCRAERLIRSL